MILRTGRIDDNVLDRSVRKRLGPLYLEETAADCYSYAVSLDTGHTAELSVIGALNGLAAQGISPTGIRTDVLLPVGAEEQLLRDIEDAIRNAAEEAGVVVAGGHTEVTAAVTRPVVVTESFGSPMKCKKESGVWLDSAEQDPEYPEWDGADLFLLGHIGLSGTWLLSEERREELETRFPVQMIRQASNRRKELLMTSAAEKFIAAVARTADSTCSGVGTDGMEKRNSVVPVMIRVSDGGIYAGLWKLAVRLNCGFEAELPRIPVYQETVEICNYYGINPYQMSSEGCLLAAPGSRVDTDRLLERCAEEDVAIHLIGRLTAGRDKVICNGDERQNLNRPATDALIPLLG